MAKTDTPQEILQRAPQALYRKYRPSAFDEVLGQEEIVTVLRAAVEQGKIGHAYLFAGGRGTGKTSMARILAAALGTSDQDLYEIDAASNRQVDDARQLREGVATLPFESTYKVYILDEVHMFTKDAFNTLLKTIEEPPAHAIFILATTELDKVPDTIQSRCQVFQFKKPSHEVLKQLVLDVAKREKVTIAPAGAELVALMGDGSFRDTLSILQKVLTVSKDTKLSEDEVAKVVGAPPTSVINSFLTALAAKDIAAALGTLHKGLAGGAEPRVFVLLAVSKVRAILLLRFAPALAAELTEQFGEDDITFLQTLAGKEGGAINAALLAELITALLETARSPMPQVPLELALYRTLG
ncbi:MAG: polymerase subunit gamma and tau, polymerase subunit gamma/tau protein [Candidatus Adlerbacteria bacterium]|nr:polymerase subunit gamma and tau, polymerase subunit gamma/tau protein [Candidatus Adlerbacteria bacterium]